MGLQDRDYYQDIYKRKSQEINRDPKNPYSSRKTEKKSSGIKTLFSILMILFSFWYGADALLSQLKNIKAAKAKPGISTQNSPDLISGGVILKSDPQGHFGGTAMVNDVPMPFLIDTGATTTTIPAKMAKKAGLPLGRQVQVNTAGGKVIEHSTRIDNLSIGNAEIRNLSANINPHLDRVLIGMNTLKHFRMTQSNNTLTLVANNHPDEIAEPFESENDSEEIASVPSAQLFTPFDTDRPIEMQTADDQPLVKTPTTWKKTVVCDQYKNCKTSYSDR